MRRVSLPVEQPCKANWEAMEGDGIVRFCRLCRKDVHDLSAMGEAAAQEFLSKGGQACVRYQFDGDGRVLFVDRAKAVLPRLAAAAALAFTSVAGSGCMMGKRASCPVPQPAGNAVGDPSSAEVEPGAEDESAEPDPTTRPAAKDSVNAEPEASSVAKSAAR